MKERRLGDHKASMRAWLSFCSLQQLRMAHVHLRPDTCPMIPWTSPQSSWHWKTKEEIMILKQVLDHLTSSCCSDLDTNQIQKTLVGSTNNKSILFSKMFGVMDQLEHLMENTDANQKKWTSLHILKIFYQQHMRIHWPPKAYPLQIMLASHPHSLFSISKSTDCTWGITCPAKRWHFHATLTTEAGQWNGSRGHWATLLEISMKMLDSCICFFLPSLLVWESPPSYGDNSTTLKNP